MQEQLEQIKKEGLEALKSVEDQEALEKWQSSYLGRNSAVMDVFKNLSTLSKEEKPQVGKAANLVKVALETALQEKEALLEAQRITRSLASER